MCTSNETPSNQCPHAVIIYSATDESKAVSLIDELKRRDAGVIPARAAESADLDVIPEDRRCAVYLSPQSVGDLANKSSVLYRDRDAVVVVMDEALETLPEEWARFHCFRYADQSLNELCRQLALLIRTPPLPQRPKDVTGYAAAFRVLNGYYQFVLPKFQKRLKQLYTDDYASCVKKLLIICPKSCQCPASMETGSIKHAEVYVLKNVPRAGEKLRDFSVPVYRIRDEERNRDYCFPAEFSNTLQGLYDMKQKGLTGIDEIDMYRESRHYVLHLQQLLQHSTYARNCRILYWKDDEVALDEFLLPVVREEVENEPVEVPESPTDFQCADGRGVNSASLYANPEDCYKLDSDPKGICLIIDIAEFEFSAVVGRPLEPRTGSGEDIRRLRDVFIWLKFKVEVYKNVIKSEFLRIIDQTRELDHSAYDAFVCCVMSHGHLGHIWSADNQSVGILDDIICPFYPESCPTLAGKPKMFFIQSCQSSSTYSEVEDQESAVDESPASETATTETDAEPYTDIDSRQRTTLLQPPQDIPDIFVSYSTLPRNKSYRSGGHGSFYVQALTEELKKGHEIKCTLSKVAPRVQQKAADSTVEGGPIKQTPFTYVSPDHKSVFLCGKILRCYRYMWKILSLVNSTLFFCVFYLLISILCVHYSYIFYVHYCVLFILYLYYIIT